MANLFLKEGRFNDAQAHIEDAKSHTANDTYLLGAVAHLQANIQYKQHRFEEARSEALHGVEIFEKLGAVRDAELCRELLQWIEEKLRKAITSDG